MEAFISIIIATLIFPLGLYLVYVLDKLIEEYKNYKARGDKDE
tara:strand:- start:494 stop:622 length:129 start_codon:yes stop_codon:yes gene_type:complete